MANNGYVVGIGAANVDIFGKSKNNLIPEDSNPGYISVSVGGVTHNMCTNASKLGLDVYLITTVGDDGYGKMITEDCQQNGIHTDHFFTLPGNVSSTYISLHNNNGEMALAVSDMHILQKLTPEMLATKDELLKNAKMIVMDTGLPEVILDFVLDTYGETVPVFIDTVSTTYGKKVIGRLGKIHTLKPNELEAEMLTGVKITDRESLKLAAQKMLDEGLQRVIISRGGDGICYADKNGTMFTAKAEKLENIANATGAGDSMAGGLMYSLINGLSPEETAKFAMSCSMLTICHEATIHPQMSAALVNSEKETHKFEIEAL